MNDQLMQASAAARNAALRKDWATVGTCAQQILHLDSANAEGHFLHGLALKAAGQPAEAIESLTRCLEIDARRYDAAVELA